MICIFLVAEMLMIFYDFKLTEFNAKFKKGEAWFKLPQIMTSSKDW
jgi:hypothetical protein